MSVEAITWALGVPVGGNQKVVLLGLANHAHPDGSSAYPALDTLARYASCDRSTAKRNTRKLEDDGWIRRDGVGPRGETKWQLAMGAPFGGGQNAPGAERTGGTSAPEGGAPAPPEPSREPSENSSAGAGARELSEMEADAAELLKAKRKVDGRLVSPSEMERAVAALTEFNELAGSGFGIGPNLTPLVMRIRERPSWDAAKLVRLVQSAFRIRWWDAPGRAKAGGRPTPAVIFGHSRVFEAVIEDAAAEARGESTAKVQERRFVRKKAAERQGDD